jgi:hypothetical protein
MQRCLDRMRVEGRVGVEVAQAARRRGLADGVDIGARVDARELLARRRRRLMPRDQSVEPERDHVIADRRQPFGTFRMIRPHLVQRARGMGDIGKSGQGCRSGSNRRGRAGTPAKAARCALAAPRMTVHIPEV